MNIHPPIMNMARDWLAPRLPTWQHLAFSRQQITVAVAEAMRRILIERARQKASQQSHPSWCRMRDPNQRATDLLRAEIIPFDMAARSKKAA
jgi:hypothetical protein